MNKKFISKLTSGVLLCTMVAYGAPVMAYTKDETVYSKLEADGNTYNIIVNSHIENDEKSDILKDLTDLLNIKNTNGDEKFTLDGNNLSWSSNGNDIYYQGETSKELPIDCTVKYELNGEEVSAKDLAGKSGNVKITIKYANKDAHTVNINGRNETLYTPFVAVCGTFVDNAKNKNIEITNGKIIDDGSKSVLMGIAMPGMQESLNISKDKLDIPDTVVITMDATDFELNNIMTYVTPKIIEEKDIDIFNKLDNIYAEVNTLQSSSKMLVEGGETLKEGTEVYKEKSEEFNGAMKQVTNGVSTINSNYSKLNDGINTLSRGSKSVQDGAEKLNQGIMEASSQLSAMPENIEKLYEGTKTLNTGVNGSSGLVVGVNTLKDNLTDTTKTAITELTKNATVLKGEIEKLTAESAEITTQVTTLKSLKDKLTVEADKTTMQNTINSLEKRKTEITTRITTLKTIAEEDKQVITALTPTKETNAKLQALETGLTQISQGTKTLEENVKMLNSATSKLPSALKQLTDGSKDLASGTKTLLTGANALNANSKLLKNGIQSLDTNTNKLLSANNQLTEGASTLEEGAKTLSEGITKFDKEGIQKICNYINVDAKNITTRLEKLQELANEYNNFTMIENGNKGNVKFIMIMDAIKATEDSKEEIINDEKK